MNFIWVINGKKLKQYIIIIVAAFFTAGILYVERSQMTVFSPNEEHSAIYKIDTNDVNLHAIPDCDFQIISDV